MFSSKPNKRNMNPPIQNKKGPTINIPMTPVMIHGPTAKFHMDAHTAKRRRHPMDAGIDLYPDGLSISDVPGQIGSWAITRVSTGVHITVLPGVYAVIMERSSVMPKLGGGMVMPSVIDTGYTGEIDFRVRHLRADSQTVHLAIGEFVRLKQAMAQLLLCPMLIPQWCDLDPKIAELRGTAGFGSTDDVHIGTILVPDFKLTSKAGP